MALISQSMITRWQMESTHTPPAINGDPWVSRGLDRKYIYIYRDLRAWNRRKGEIPLVSAFRSHLPSVLNFRARAKYRGLETSDALIRAGWGGLIAVEPSPRPVASTGFNRATYRGWHGFEMIEIRMADKITLFLQRSWQVVLRFNF